MGRGRAISQTQPNSSWNFQTMRLAASTFTLRSCIRYQFSISPALPVPWQQKRIGYATTTSSKRNASLLVGEPATATTTTPPPPERLPPVDRFPQSEEELRNAKPPELIRPIGLSNPPQAGENSGIDRRGLRQRFDDFVDSDKHLERRRQLSVHPPSPPPALSPPL